jgi:uncharacterized protein (TIGR03118 family)
MHMGLSRVWSTGALLFAAGVLLGTRAEAQHYQQTNLVSDEPGLAVNPPDPHLVNPWGLARSSTSPWWVANNGTGTSTLYNGSGIAQSLVVTIPPAPGSSEGGVPTGTVFNGSTDFQLVANTPTTAARFIFVTEDGTISGWNPSVNATNAVIKFPPAGVDNSAAVYKGVAIASNQGARFLYATNFSQQRIDVFDATFTRIPQPQHVFEDERLTAQGFSPFNVQNIGGDLYVTFAKRDPATNDDVAGAGLGYVDVFSPGGQLLRRLEHGPWLNSPWGLALAPSDFGTFSHALLVGQFGSGEIAAYDVTTGRFIGKLLATSGDPVTIDGLWALGFGNGGNAGPFNTLFFTAGIDDESHGLFGTLTAVAAEQILGNSQ